MTLSTAASIVGVARSWPQLRKIVVQGNATGVSSLTWMLSLFTTLIWEVLGVALGVLPTAIYNVLLAIGQGAVLAVLVRHGHLAWWKPVSAAVSAIAVGALTVATLGRPGISILAFATATCMFLPQAAKVVRGPAHGVSVVSWALAVCSGSLWTAYGLAIGELAIAAPGLVTVPVAGFITLKAMAANRANREHRRANELEAPGVPIA